MQSVFRFRVFCIQLVLLGLTFGSQVALGQDVQMVPDRQDREAADKAQTQKTKTKMTTSRSPRSRPIPTWSNSSLMLRTRRAA